MLDALYFMPLQEWAPWRQGREAHALMMELATGGYEAQDHRSCTFDGASEEMLSWREITDTEPSPFMPTTACMPTNFSDPSRISDTSAGAPHGMPDAPGKD